VAAAPASRGGRLFLHDVHPLANALAAGELVATSTHFEEREPEVDHSGCTCTDGPFTSSTNPTYSWNHGLAEIVTAVLRPGLELERLEEHDWTSFARFPWLVRQRDQHFAIPPGRPRLPLSFSLLARRS